MYKKIMYCMAVLLSLVAWHGVFYAFLGVEGLFFAAIAPATLDDAGINKHWRGLAQEAYWLALWKTGFSDPSYTGTNKSRRSIDPRGDILGPPFVEYYDLKNIGSGDRLTDTIHIPPFDGDDEVLFGAGGSTAGYIRVKGQKRVGYEVQGSRKNIDFALQSYFFSMKEEDLNMSNQELGGDLIPLLLEHLTNLHGRYYDADRIVSLHLGYSPHVYTRIAQQSSTIANGDPLSANTNLGVPEPSEHPNTYAWINEGSLAAPEYKLLSANSITTAVATTNTATSWGGKVHEAVGQVTSEALVGRRMLDLVMEELKLLRIVPTTYVVSQGSPKGMYLTLVSPAVMNQFINDNELQKRFDSAFQGAMGNHPLIQEGDKIYRQLIIREVEKFAQSMYSYKINYGPAYDYGTTASGGLDARPSLDGAGTDATGVTYVISGTGEDKRINASLGTRTFRSTSDAGISVAGDTQPAGEDTAIGPDGGDKIDRVVVLGASALGCVPGPVYPLDRRQEDDYGRIVGLGQEKLAANRRIDFPTSRSHNSGYDNQGSMVIAVYNGK